LGLAEDYGDGRGGLLSRTQDAPYALKKGGKNPKKKGENGGLAPPGIINRNKKTSESESMLESSPREKLGRS